MGPDIVLPCGFSLGELCQLFLEDITDFLALCLFSVPCTSLEQFQFPEKEENKCQVPTWIFNTLKFIYMRIYIYLKSYTYVSYFYSI